MDGTVGKIRPMGNHKSIHSDNCQQGGTDSIEGYVVKRFILQ